MSSVLSLCRICLTDNTSLRSVKNNLLQSFYEKLTDTKLNSEDARLSVLCCYCYQKLLRCYIFTQMAIKSEKILDHLYDRDLEVTHDYITKNKVDMKQHLTVAVMEYITIEHNATNAGAQVTIKEEPLPDEEEEVISKLDKLLEFESFPDDSTKSELLEEDYSIVENDVEELLNIHVKQTIPDGTQIDTAHTFRCNNCNKIFYIKSKLILHIKKSHSQLTGKKYSLNKKHTDTTSMMEDKTICNQKKNLTCNVCEKQFNYKSHLVQHMSIHTGGKPFVCKVCNKKFNRKGDLVKHMRVHTGEKPFACNVCDKQFNESSNLVKHMRIHTGEKPFACNVCDKKCNHKGNLVRHMRVHTGAKPFACNLCDKQFNQKCHLVEHMRIHTGEKLFACSICKKQLSRKGDLVLHMRIHTGEKPFACNVCDKQFNRKYSLVLHMRTHR